MFSADLAVLSERHGISEAALSELHDLLRKASGTRSLGASFVDADRSISLTPEATWADEGNQLEASAPAGSALFPQGPEGRYEDLGLLGFGGMAEVHRVRDRDLNRTMAMKIIRKELANKPATMARFVEEAQCSAQLQHPGIVPVHEIGELPDGRPYFTMAEVKGRTFAAVIEEVHRAKDDHRWHPTPDGWTFRRLIDVFHRACEAVAYAHARGVVHRDLKPDNIMVGPHGEVLVVDWGLAKVHGHAADVPVHELVSTDRSQDHFHATRLGLIMGTPSYMPPEQARGEIALIDARSDVYSLGATLYQLLSGRAPYDADSGEAVIGQVLSGPPSAPGRASASVEDQGSPGWAQPRTSVDENGGPALPPDLVDTCRRAMSRDREDRFEDGTSLATEIGSWLDGAKRRERALHLVGKALELRPTVAALRAQATEERTTSDRMLEDLNGWDSEEVKAPGWQLADHADTLDRAADALELQFIQKLHGALTHAPTLSEAHAALTEQHQWEHVQAEQARSMEAATRAEALMTTHSEALPPAHPVRTEAESYRKGTGALTLVTQPPGAQISLYRYETQNRRMVAVFERALDQSPLREVSVERGSYLAILQHPDCEDVRYPVHIGRRTHWTGVPPNAERPHPIPLPPKGSLAPDERYVPPGWFESGGDTEAPDVLPGKRLWCDGLVMKRFPVTNAKYIEFLDDLVAQGREEEALDHVPRERSATQNTRGVMLYGRRDDGRFFLQPDAEGDLWDPHWPVFQVDWFGAAGYAAWLSEKTGQPWRIPSELEWEKAARGVDGRCFPWGDEIDPSWCSCTESHADGRAPASIHDYPVDESVYGIRGLGGNMQCWCADIYASDGPDITGDRVHVPNNTREDLIQSPYCVYRGGSWLNYPRYARSANRNWNPPNHRIQVLGIRVVRSL